MLSDEDREAIAKWEPHADWCNYADKTDEGCTPQFGCNVWGRRDLLAEIVEQIVARHVAAALNDAADRTANAARVVRANREMPERARRTAATCLATCADEIRALIPT